MCCGPRCLSLFVFFLVLFLAIAFGFRNVSSRVAAKDMMIPRPIEDVWIAVSRLDQYQHWSSFYKRIEDASSYAVGDRVSAFVELVGLELPIGLVIKEIDPPKRICWSGVPMGDNGFSRFFLTSYRCIELAEVGVGGKTVISSHEDLGGIFGVLAVQLLGPSLTEKFNSVHADLSEFLLGMK